LTLSPGYTVGRGSVPALFRSATVGRTGTEPRPTGRRRLRLFNILLTGVLVASAASAVPPTTPKLPPKTQVYTPPSPEEQKRQQEISRAQRAARQAESDSDWERALDLWKFVDEQRPGDISAYSGIKRCLVSLSRFDEALKFLDKAEKTMAAGKGGIDPSNVGADRVEVLFAAGRDADAENEMERQIATHKGYPNLYRSLANVLYSKRRSDDAIALLKRGRADSGERFMFAREIAQFAEARMDWNTAVNEYLLYLTEAPDRLSYTTGALGDIMSEAGGDTLVFKAIERYSMVSDPRVKDSLLELKAGLLLRARRYEEAVTAYQELDRLRGGDGELLLELADKLTDEGENLLALNAFTGLLQTATTQDLRYRALLGRARVAEKLGWLDSAKVAYEEILTPGSRIELIVEANYRLGIITLKSGGTPEAARIRFESAAKLIKQSPGAAGNLAEAVLINLALTYELSGDLDRAKQELERLVKAAGARAGAASEARMELARIAFRRGDIEAAKRENQSLLAADAGSPAANEALEMLALFDGLSDSPDAVKVLGRVDLLSLLRLRKDAFWLLDSLARHGATARIKEEALWAGLKLADDANNPSEAMTRLEGIIALSPSAIKLDKALWETGRRYYERGDSIKALSYFDRLLNDFPDSPLGDQVRRLARTIRSDHL